MNFYFKHWLEHDTQPDYKFTHVESSISDKIMQKI